MNISLSDTLPSPPLWETEFPERIFPHLHPDRIRGLVHHDVWCAHSGDRVSEAIALLDFLVEKFAREIISIQLTDDGWFVRHSHPDTSREPPLSWGGKLVFVRHFDVT